MNYRNLHRKKISRSKGTGILYVVLLDIGESISVIPDHSHSKSKLNKSLH